MILAGKKCLVSGSGNVAQHAAEKLIELGATVLTCQIQVAVFMIQMV